MTRLTYKKILDVLNELWFHQKAILSPEQTQLLKALADKAEGTSVVVEYRREDDGRWTAAVDEFELSITRNSLDHVRWAVWEWLSERLQAGALTGIGGELADAILTLQTVGRVEDPWVGRADSPKFLPIASVVDAVQWTGGNLPEVIRYVSHTNGFVVIPTGGRYLVLENAKGKSAIDSGDWVIRDSDNNLALMSDQDFRKMFVPLPDKPVGQDVPVLRRIPDVPADQLVQIHEGREPGPPFFRKQTTDKGTP